MAACVRTTLNADALLLNEVFSAHTFILQMVIGKIFYLGKVLVGLLVLIQTVAFAV